MGGFQVGAAGEGPFDRLLHGQIGQRCEHHAVGKGERLARRQANQPRQGDFALGQIVFIGGQPLLIGNQLHLGAGDVDARREARGVPVGGLLQHGLRRRDLGPRCIHAGGGGEHVQIAGSDGGNHHVARVVGPKLDGLFGHLAGSPVAAACNIEQRLRQPRAEIEIMIGADDGGKVEADAIETGQLDSAEAQRRQVALLVVRQ